MADYHVSINYSHVVIFIEIMGFNYFLSKIITGWLWINPISHSLGYVCITVTAPAKGCEKG